MAAFVALLAPARAAFACSCAGMGTDAGADAVFTGTVVAANDANANGAMIGSFDPIVYRFDVDGVEKGAVREGVEVTSARDGASCGLGFRIGGRYRVLADRRDDGTLTTGTCSGTTRVDEILGAPPVVQVSESQEVRLFTLPRVAILAIGGVAAVAGLLVLRRRGSGAGDGGVVP